MLEEVHDRLAGVVIERLPYSEFTTRYDRPGALFYCDPPYWGCEEYYGKGIFECAYFERLEQGRFMISLNDVPEVRHICAGHAIQPVTVRYTLGRADHSIHREVIVTGLGRAAEGEE